jgi:aspartyl-tRNA(Asn)/glutamyl-tRNA(Gln) amidotransferase subunit C
MKISIEQVEHVAKLARLRLSEEEKQEMSEKLSQILTYMDKLNELNTDGILPTSHVVEIKNVFREDKVEPSLPEDQALQNAPDRVNGYFRVPRVIE